jgi:DNA modification methylase
MPDMARRTPQHRTDGHLQLARPAVHESVMGAQQLAPGLADGGTPDAVRLDLPWQVLRGDCREQMRRLPANSVDSIVCDPPYGLSKEPDAMEMLRHWLAGDDYEHSGEGFLGKSWDSFVPGPSYWRECLRVLKPGGYLVATSGARTYDLTTLAVRLAGFEIRECLYWHYGSGMPKSHNVSAGIDTHHFRAWLKNHPAEKTQLDGRRRELRQARAKLREAVKADAAPDVRAAHEDAVEAAHRRAHKCEDTLRERSGTKRENTTATAAKAAATDDAKRWTGFGTALKPATEPIIVARKPLDPKAKTVAANVLAHGTGALNIDATRIGTGKIESAQTASAQNGNHKDDGAQREFLGHTEGRWPATALWSHSPDCRLVGEHEVASNAHWGESNVSGYGQGIGTGSAEYHGPGYRRRTETVEHWECAPGCPVAELDRQSGANGEASRFFLTTAAGHEPELPIERVHAREEADFLYTPKPGSKERNAGLDHLPESNPFARSGPSANFAGMGSKSSKRRNIHPTVKSAALMQWLCRLFTPPGGLVLDPFCGSGSTGCAVMAERNSEAAPGWRFLGIEQEEAYVDIARARVAHSAGDREPETPEQLAPPANAKERAA